MCEAYREGYKPINRSCSIASKAGRDDVDRSTSPLWDVAPPQHHYEAVCREE